MAPPTTLHSFTFSTILIGVFACALFIYFLCFSSPEVSLVLFFSSLLSLRSRRKITKLTCWWLHRLFSAQTCIECTLSHSHTDTLITFNRDIFHSVARAVHRKRSHRINSKLETLTNEPSNLRSKKQTNNMAHTTISLLVCAVCVLNGVKRCETRLFEIAVGWRSIHRFGCTLAKRINFDSIDGRVYFDCARSWHPVTKQYNLPPCSRQNSESEKKCLMLAIRHAICIDCTALNKTIN